MAREAAFASSSELCVMAGVAGRIHLDVEKPIAAATKAMTNPPRHHRTTFPVSGVIG